MKRNPPLSYEFIPTTKQADKYFYVKSLFSDDVSRFLNRTGEVDSYSMGNRGEEIEIVTVNKNQKSLF